MIAPGMRVLVRGDARGYCAAWAGANRYYLLARDVTGWVIDVHPHPTRGMVSVRPDGWPVPAGVWPEGMMVSIDRVQPIAENAPAQCGQIAHGTGVSVETAQKEPP